MELKTIMELLNGLPELSLALMLLYLLRLGLLVLLATWFPLITLAKATSFVILAIFTLINLSLIRLKLQGRIRRRGIWSPVVGATLSAALLLMSFF